MRPVVTVGTSLPDATYRIQTCQTHFLVGRRLSTRSRCSRCRCCCCLRTGNVVIVIIRSIHFLEVFCATMRLFGSILLRRGEHSAYFRGIFFRVFLYVRDKALVRLYTLYHTVHLAISCCSNKVAAKGLAGLWRRERFHRNVLQPRASLA